MKCAVIGLGEVGQIYSSAIIAQGHSVSAFDPFVKEAPEGVVVADSAAAAVSDADIVLVLTGAGAARAVANECLPAMEPRAIYADLTSSSPIVMSELGQTSGEVSFVDVAILGPVIAQKAQTPLMASGKDAERFADFLRPLGAEVTVVDGGPGRAMSHKLLRSVFTKGLINVVVEAVEAGEAAGIGGWVREQIANSLAGDGQAVIDRYISGTQKHAARRGAEMRATAAYLAELGIPHEMTEASAVALERIAAGNQQASN